jgi:hypothetical protein
MDKLLNENQKKQLTTSDTQETDNNGFINIPEGVDEQLPFN